MTTYSATIPQYPPYLPFYLTAETAYTYLGTAEPGYYFDTPTNRTFGPFTTQPKAEANAQAQAELDAAYLASQS